MEPAKSDDDLVKVGRRIGPVIVAIGVVCSLIAEHQVTNSGKLIRLLAMGPALALVGIAMTLFPGAPITRQEWRSLSTSPEWFREAPLVHKAVWVLGGVAGVVFAVDRWIFSFVPWSTL